MARGHYSWLERTLHRTALHPLVAEASLDLECLRVRPDATEVGSLPHVFISGLARAGSTALLRALERTSQFRSLTYRDMPFVMMPGLWRLLRRPFERRVLARERPHNDSIEVDGDSPEALEEVFWRTFARNDYLKPDRLVPHAAETKIIEKFRYFVAIALASDPKSRSHYLSKNNNNVLRLGSIRVAFPRALIVIPFRDPVQHSLSLLRQHLQFTALHDADHFARDYMSLLAHHEFGRTHKPFIYSPQEWTEISQYRPSDPVYWLQIWTQTYRYLLAQAPKEAIYTAFEDFCAAPEASVRRILEFARLPVDDRNVELPFSPRPHMAPPLPEQLLGEAYTTYAELVVRAGEAAAHPANFVPAA